MEMNKAICFILSGILPFIVNLFGGFHLDEQVNYPNDNKHLIKISKENKKYFYFENKKTRQYFFRWSVIMEKAGYVESLISVITTVVSLIINNEPALIVSFTVIFTFLGVDLLYAMVVYAYYKIKFK